jgi:hypothetical protein
MRAGSINASIWRNKRHLHHGLNAGSRLLPVCLVLIYSVVNFSFLYVFWRDSFFEQFSSPVCQNACYYQTFFTNLLFEPQSILMSWVRKKLQFGAENLLYREELTLNLYFSVVPVSLGIVVYYFFPRIFGLGHTMYLLSNWIGAFFFIPIICCTPVLYQKEASRFHGNLQPKDLSALKQILTDEGDEFNGFVDFLRSEFGAEKAYFWKAIEHLKHGRDSEQFDELSQRIREQFVSRDANIFLEISPQIRSTLLRLVDPEKAQLLPFSEYRETCLSLYSAAQYEVFLQMAKDSYPRFKSSQEESKTSQSYSLK